MKWMMGIAAAALLASPAWAQSKPPAQASEQTQMAQMQAQLQDWPDFSRYAADNAALGAPKPGEKRVVFFGDSITDIWGRMPGTGKFFPGKPYVNRGISGQTTEQMLVRFQQDVVALHPAAVLILAGTNDVAGNTGPETPQMIKDDYTSMGDIADRSGIKVIFASITPAAAYPWRPAVHPVEEIHALNAWLKQFCAQRGYTYLDYFSAMAGPDGGMLPGISVDGVHPNGKGFAIMAPLAEAAIQKTLAK